MARFSEIQQFPDFLKLFSGNFRIICPPFENFDILGRNGQLSRGSNGINTATGRSNKAINLRKVREEQPQRH